MLVKEPEMLQPDAFCERTMQQKCERPLGVLTVLPRPLASFKGPLRGGEGRGKEGREGWRGKGKGGEGQGWRGRGGEVDSDAYLEQGRRWAKADPPGFCKQRRNNCDF